MKTLQELYDKVKNSDELKKAFAEAAKSGKLDDFLKAHECDANAEELREFIAEKVSHDRPLKLTKDELDKVAGGNDDGERDGDHNGNDLEVYISDSCSSLCTMCC
ncbi:MAG: hypothetical protein IJT58_00380 [Synergistaceae bacterium]|nr:hypothetical protein [Synergistaceae bacterium]